MNNSMLVLLVSILTIGGLSTNCQSRDTKQVNAGEKVQDGKHYMAETPSNANMVQHDTITDYRKFILQSEEQIVIYEKSIAALEVKIAEQKNDEKTKYEKKLADLKQKNEKLKTNLNDYKKVQVENWNEKQLEFSNDMDELGKTIAGFFNRD